MGTISTAIEQWGEADDVCESIVRQTKCTILASAIDILDTIPGCLRSFWAAIEPSFNNHAIANAADDLRGHISASADLALRFPDHLAFLADAGYSREAIRQIRYVTEVFYQIEPIHAIMAAIAAIWLEGSSPSVVLSPDSKRSAVTPYLMGKIDLATVQQTNDSLYDLSPLHLNPCHRFYRALALWPDYMKRIGETVSTAVTQNEYQNCVADARHTMYNLAISIPMNPINTSIHKRYLAQALSESVSVSSEVMLIVCALRRMFARAEAYARGRRVREERKYFVPSIF